MANGIGDSKILSLTEQEQVYHKRVMDIRNRQRVVDGPTFEFRMLKDSEMKESLLQL